MMTIRGFLVGLCLLISMPSGVIAAQAVGGRKPPPPGNRYLFVIENSSSMQARDEAVQEALFDLVHSGARGQMESGDTFGVWTFNSTVDTRFPMQTWDSANRLNLSARVNIFLRNQGYKRRSRLDAVVADVHTVAKSVDQLTVFFLLDGLDRMAGTPFDSEINEMFKDLSQGAARSKAPILMGLRAEKGEFTAYSVVPSGEQLTLPPLPRRIPPSQPVVKVNQTAIAATPPRRVAPIIMTRDGSTTDPEALTARPAPPESQGGQAPATRSVAQPSSQAPVQPAEKSPQPVPSPGTNGLLAKVTAGIPTPVPQSRSNVIRTNRTDTGLAGKGMATNLNVVRVIKTTAPVVETPPKPPEPASSPEPIVPPVVPPAVSSTVVAPALSSPVAAPVEPAVVPTTSREVSRKVAASNLVADLEWKGATNATRVSSLPMALTSPLMVQARERPSLRLPAADPGVPTEVSRRSPAPLAAAVLLMIAGLAGVAVWVRRRSHNVHRGSAITRAMPAPGSGRKRPGDDTPRRP